VIADQRMVVRLTNGAPTTRFLLRAIFRSQREASKFRIVSTANDAVRAEIQCHFGAADPLHAANRREGIALAMTHCVDAITGLSYRAGPCPATY
jgi:hypothetical protein